MEAPDFIMSRRSFQIQPEKLNTELFRDLMDLLYVRVMQGNIRGTARLLGISSKTMQKWTSTTPPVSQWWWNIILIHCIRETYKSMHSSKSKKTKRASRQLISDLSRILPRDAEYMEWNEARDSGARRHLLSLFVDHDQVSTKMLRQERYAQGYTPRALREAARVLELDRVTEGFGDDKVTYYRLPRD